MFEFVDGWGCNFTNAWLGLCKDCGSDGKPTCKRSGDGVVGSCLGTELYSIHSCFCFRGEGRLTFVCLVGLPGMHRAVLGWGEWEGW